MNEMIVKEFNSKQIRSSLDDDGNPWFVAKDVCDVLDIRNQRHALRKLENDQRGGVGLPSPSGIQEFTTVSESGLYILIMNSSKPIAKEFMMWITRDVLPSIRKTGSYSLVPKEELDPLDILENHVKKMRQLQDNAASLARQVVVIDKKVDEIDTKMNTEVSTINKTLTQMMTMRRGNEPTPVGTIPAKKIRQKYFFGVSEDVIRDYLTYRKHPKTPFIYKTESGSEISSFAWNEEGLAGLYLDLINECKFVKETPQKIMMTHKATKKGFGFKSIELPNHINYIIAKKILDSLKL